MKQENKNKQSGMVFAKSEDMEEEKKLTDAITPISEEMANQLIKAFEDCNKATAELHEKVEEFIVEACRAAAVEMVGRVVRYSEKCVKATFLTRWYWYKKAKKAYSDLFDTCDFIEKHFKNKINDATERGNNAVSVGDNLRD